MSRETCFAFKAALPTDSVNPNPVTLACQAMATRFEIVLHGNDPVALRAAGEEALGEIERLEAQLSLYRNTSEIAHVNARAAREPVRVSPEVFRLLEQAQRLSAETGGAFDVTIAPLVRCWGFMGGTGQLPTAEAVAEARAKVGMHLLELNRAEFTVRFAREGMMLDLGAVGKGYAIERAAQILRDDVVESAILHGGTSTVQAIGQMPDGQPWKVAIERPVELPDSAPIVLAVVSLKDEALSVSAVWGRSFKASERSYGHVIDPRTGSPTDAAVLSAVILPSATETDALSTALLALGPPGLALMVNRRAALRSLVLSREEGRLKTDSVGITILPLDQGGGNHE
jgi:thiamine biosynthesis lipoprotein